MPVFSPMDSWIAATGRTDDWLALGLDLLECWQTGDDPGADQAHLVEVLAGLQVVRPVTPEAPDPLVLAVWFHHADTAYDRLAALGGPLLAHEVARLVRQLGLRHPDRGDAAGGLLHAAHRAAVSPVHLAAVPPVTGDQ